MLELTDVFNDGKKVPAYLKAGGIDAYLCTCKISIAILYWSDKISLMEQRKPPDRIGRLAFCY
ncbi:hypothetical protein BGI33_00385 [Snodgrassella alvi]|nr:hypothetical protein BGI34_11460 [Snodgrassella alvi]PIT18965.1 hypothetical protein BGI33_00385 [Snodgrassella alvi]